jgi:hypothetical protein
VTKSLPTVTSDRPTQQIYQQALRDHLRGMSMQERVTQLEKTLAPATMGTCFGTLRTVLRSPMQTRLIAIDPTGGVTA